MDIYREEILDHYKNPRNYGSLKEATHQASDRNASCGDLMEMSLKVKKGRIEAVKFKGEGCAISMAAASMLTEKIKGRRVAEIELMTDKDIAKMLGVKISLTRMKCATLGLVVCQKAITQNQ